MESTKNFIPNLEAALTNRNSLVIEKLPFGSSQFRTSVHEDLSQNNRMKAFDKLVNIGSDTKRHDYIDAVLLAGRFLLCNRLIPECYIFLTICQERIAFVYGEPIDYTLVEEIGNMFYLSGQSELAIKWYERLMDLNEAPESRMYFNIGMCHQIEGNYSKAIENYSKSTYADPKFSKSWVNLGYCYLHDNHPDKALQAFQQLPLSGENLVCIGNAYFRQGNFEEAIAFFLRSSEIKEDSGTYNNLGVALKKVGLFQDAICAFNDSLALKPNSEAATNLLTLYLEMGKKTDAQNLYKICGNIISVDDNKELLKLYEQQFPTRRSTIMPKSNKDGFLNPLAGLRKSTLVKGTPRSNNKTPRKSGNFDNQT